MQSQCPTIKCNLSVLNSSVIKTKCNLNVLNPKEKYKKMSKDEKEKGKKKKEKKKKETKKKMSFLYATRAMPGHNDLW